MISIDSKAYEPFDSFATEYDFQATFVYLLGAVKDFLPDTFKYGLKTAGRLFRFRISPRWLKHLASDRYLSQQQFKVIYSCAFPSCSFTRFGCFMGMIWEAL